MPEQNIDCEVLIIGSGPGGSITAALLAEAGRDVILVEEGPYSKSPGKSYTLDEMNRKYRNGGLTPAFGKTKITYIEPRCMGGGSEINAGLYHRPLNEKLNEWKTNYQIDNLVDDSLAPFYEANEKELTISTVPDGAGPASIKIQAGAEKMKWESHEIPRFWKYSKNDDGSFKGTRQSMSETFIPRAENKGCRLLPNTKVKRIVLQGNEGKYAQALSTDDMGITTNLRIYFRNVFVCGGAVQTPALLRRSGIKKNIGDSLAMHPMVRMPALFNEKVNEEHRGVPVHQVQEFKPNLTLGCSLSTPPYLSLWLADHPGNIQERLKRWPNMAVYYAATITQKRGTIRNLPWLDEPFVRLPLTSRDMEFLGEGLYKLGRLLFSVGAVELLPPVLGYPLIRKEQDLEIFKKRLPQGKSNITTIHLFSSCPMGEDTRKCAVNSYGKLHDFKNIYINDASMLPGAPGVNPQGTIMALARRNVDRFLQDLQ